MDRTNFLRDVTGIAALNEPVRRDLYLFVIAQDGPVGRDEASDGVGVARHTAKFHLDKLVEDGLLNTEFKRLTGRRGPGAGRPTKLYKRSAAQFDVTLPERHYDLAGQLMAQAIEESTHTGEPVVECVARRRGGGRGQDRCADRRSWSGPDRQGAAAVDGL